MTPEERTDVENALADQTSFGGSTILGETFGAALVTVIVICAFYGTGGWFVGYVVDVIWNVSSAVFYGIAIGIALAIASIILLVLSERRTSKRTRAELARQLQEGRVEEIRFHVSCAARLREIEDEGSGFFLQVADGLILFLQGQHLEDLNPFPAENVVMKRPVGSPEMFWDVEASGKRKRPVRVLDPLPLKQRDRALEETVFAGSIDTIERDVAAIPKCGRATDDLWQRIQACLSTLSDRD